MKKLSVNESMLLVIYTLDSEGLYDKDGQWREFDLLNVHIMGGPFMTSFLDPRITSREPLTGIMIVKQTLVVYPAEERKYWPTRTRVLTALAYALGIRRLYGWEENVEKFIRHVQEYDRTGILTPDMVDLALESVNLGLMYVRNWGIPKSEYLSMCKEVLIKNKQYKGHEDRIKRGIEHIRRW